MKGYSGKWIQTSQGDVLSAKFTYNPATGVIKVAGKNVTTGQSVVTVGHTSGLTWTGASYTFVNFNRAQTIPTFTSIPFSALTLDASPANTAAAMSGFNLFNQADTHLEVKALQLNAAGTAFSDVFVAAS